MTSDNKINPAKGRLFQEQVRQALTTCYGVEFLMDHPIAIGHPAKKHRFNLVSVDYKYIVECKNYSWTNTGNVPSAKMAFCNQAILHLSYMPRSAKKLLVMRKATHPKRQETIAEYYKRINKLLNEVIIIEFDTNSSKLTTI
jgi:hypothetical protein